VTGFSTVNPPVSHAFPDPVVFFPQLTPLQHAAGALLIPPAPPPPHLQPFFQPMGPSPSPLHLAQTFLMYIYHNNLIIDSSNNLNLTKNGPTRAGSSVSFFP